MTLGGLESFVNEALKFHRYYEMIEEKKFENKYCNCGGFIP